MSKDLKKENQDLKSQIGKLERQNKNIKIQNEELETELEHELISKKTNKCYRIPDHLDNIVVDSAIEKLFKNLDKISPVKLEQFVNSQS